MTLLLFVGSDQILELSGLQNGLDGSYINNATVSARITDQLDRPIVASFTLTYVTASDGVYRGAIDDSAPFVVNRQYNIYVTADGGGGLMSIFKEPAFAQYRT